MGNRPNLLCEAGATDKDIRRGMLQVVNMLEAKYHPPVRNDQGMTATTRMAGALICSRCGEEIEPLDNELLAKLAQSSY